MWAIGLLFGGLLSPSALEGAGPWRAQVVDADTREPLEGVVVLAVWHRWAVGHPAFGFGRTGYYASAEAVTGAKGWFTLPARLFVNLGMGLRIEGPDLALFKAGYGGWRVVGDPEALTGVGARIEMRPLRTREERIRYLEGQWTKADAPRLEGWRHADRPENPIDVPYEQAQRYEAAINAERAFLGLAPIGVGFPSLWASHSRRTSPGAHRGEFALRGARGVAIDSTGHIYVADTDNHRLVTFTRALEVVATWGTFGRGTGQFQSPRGIAIGQDGTVYVADWGNHRVQMFRPDGRFLGTFGARRFEDFDSGSVKIEGL